MSQFIRAGSRVLRPVSSAVAPVTRQTAAHSNQQPQFANPVSTPSNLSTARFNPSSAFSSVTHQNQSSSSFSSPPSSSLGMMSSSMPPVAHFSTSAGNNGAPDEDPPEKDPEYENVSSEDLEVLVRAGNKGIIKRVSPGEVIQLDDHMKYVAYMKPDGGGAFYATGTWQDATQELIESLFTKYYEQGDVEVENHDQLFENLDDFIQVAEPLMLSAFRSPAQTALDLAIKYTEANCDATPESQKIPRGVSETNREELLKYVKMSYDVYRENIENKAKPPVENEEDRKFSEANKLIETKVDPKTGFVADVYKNESKKEIVIAFRGSKTLQDWTYANLITSNMVPEQYRQAEELVWNVKHGNPGFRIVVTGHSKGGGQATYAAIANSVDAITFNPAPLRAALRNDLIARGKYHTANKDRILNVRHQHDIATRTQGHLPGKTLNFKDECHLFMLYNHKLTTLRDAIKNRHAAYEKK